MANAIIGFLIGVFVSLIGGGGASLYLGVLSAQLPAQTAVTTSLFVALPALFCGTLSQVHIHNVRFRLGNQMILAALPAIFAGTWLSRYIPEKLYSILIGILLIVMGLMVLVKNLRKKSEKRKAKKPVRSEYAWLLGLLSGLMVGFGGLSGGATTTAGLAMLGLSTFEAAGTATYVICAMSALGLASHLLTSSVSVHAGLSLMAGAVLGSVITPLFLSRLDMKKLNRPLGIFLGAVVVLFGLKMLAGVL